jgi:SSS family solute:Na+ symporter
MSIGAANLFTRNIWKPLIRPQIQSGEEAMIAKIVSLIVKLGALMFIIFVPTQYAIDLQLLGGILILQILPAVVLGLYRSAVRGNALLLGWIAGTVTGIWLFVVSGLKPVFVIPVFGSVYPVYVGILALLINFAVSFGSMALSVLVRSRSVSRA